ncbi:5'-nucleotidase isoform X1 [Octopus sinensis]|uniref:5'-nucleotidase isoform X1 n=1 Tax=Octopus sinensis TaxID=2607531 RepID=A0A6P7SPI9_9MOLL|nr:5'-nucleotidase isoform X1 [Octopus sinensis]XP_036359059.1 5'-nucleotidase isoform X1 [Octopus sinensis]XP_036359061.1 5'-nucleotidase isoform X1 [Octopus sinensis]
MADEVTIIHFNDVYNIEPRSDEPKGGAARFANYVQTCKDLNPIVLFSGDIFNPSLLSVFTQGEQMIPILKACKVQCSVFGNHDFGICILICNDELTRLGKYEHFGVDRLLELSEKSMIPWLMSNVTDNITEKPLANGALSYMLEWNGKKIGLIGLVEKEWIATLGTLDPEDVTFQDFVAVGSKIGKELKDDGADIVIALTHMRWPNDERLAEEAEHIDLILGGHDHDYGLKEVNGRYILKSGTDFRNLSKITLKWPTPEPSSVIVDIERIDLDSSYPEDEDTKEVVNDYLKIVDTKLDEELGNISVPLDGRFSAVRTRETNLGNFITDIMLSATQADVALINSGTFRSDRIHPKGPFKLQDLMDILPMVDPLVVLKITGAKLVEALENSVSEYPKLEGRFGQVSGIIFGFDPSKPQGHRVESELIKVQGEYLELEKTYLLCTKAYLAHGKDGYDMFKDCEFMVNEDEGPVLSTAVRNHFESVQMIQGIKSCRSGHRQSLIGLVRKKSLINKKGDENKKSKPRHLVRQESIHDVENELCNLAPIVEGRIFMLDDVKREVMLSLKQSSEHLLSAAVPEETGYNGSHQTTPNSDNERNLVP